MNYRHLYHAGSFTDVVKHLVTIAIVSALEKKPSGFCYIDTHAGAGSYDLFSEQAGKTKEFETGIERIIQSDNPPPLVKSYIHCVHQINNKLSGSKYASLQYYPGSPLIVRHFIRSQDRIIACELQPQEYDLLRKLFASDKQVAIHHTDGFLALKAFLPPKERRGLILIDPPYENPEEFVRIAHSLQPALKRFDSGVFAIWYPIKERAQVARFHKNLRDLFSNPILITELTIFPDLPNHLNGCGMAIINPVWQLQETLDQLLPWLWKALTINEQGRYSTYLL